MLLKEKYFVPLEAPKMSENFDLLTDIAVPDLLSSDFLSFFHLFLLNSTKSNNLGDFNSFQE